MRILATREFFRSRELSITYIVKIDISDNGTVCATFTINESAIGLFLEKMQILNPEIELHRMQTTAQNSSAEYRWRTDNHTLITAIGGLKESSLISIEFADEICRELPNFIQNPYGQILNIISGFDNHVLINGRRNIGSILDTTYPDERPIDLDDIIDTIDLEIANSVNIAMGLQDRSVLPRTGGVFSEGLTTYQDVELPLFITGEVPPPEPFNYRTPNRRQLQFFPHHQAMQPIWQNYDPIQYGSDVPRSNDREPPKPGIYSEKIDELISKKIISESDIPDAIRCLIGSHIMTDPVHFSCLPENNYDRPMIEHWLHSHPTDPMTRKPATVNDLVSAAELKEKIQFFVAQAELKANNQDNKFDEAKAQCAAVATVQTDAGVSMSHQPRPG